MSDPTPLGARERDARAAGSIVAGVIFQASYVLAQFVILAVLFRAVGEERFGMWVTIFGITMWLSVLPLGMNRAVLTWLGRVAFHQPKMARRVLEAATGVVALTSGTAAIVIGVWGWRLPWAQILNVSGETARHDAAATAVVALLATALSMPAVLGGFVLQAYQRGATRHLLGIVSQVSGLLLLLLGVWRGWPLPVLAALIVSPLMIGGVLQWIAVWRLLPTSPPGGVGTSRVVGPMLRMGLGLWLADLALILIVNSGPLIVAQVDGAVGVVPYGAVYRLVGPIFVCYVVIAHSYWSAFGDAAKAQDRRWIVRSVRRSIVLGAGLWLIGAAGCLLLGEPFIVWWLGEEARPGMALIVSGLAFALAHGVYHLSASALGGLGYIRVQAIVSLVVLAAFVVATWVCAGSLNATGVMLIQSAGVGLVGVINAVYLVRVLRRPTAQAT